MASTFFTLRLAPAEVRRRPAVDRLAFQRFAAEFTLQRKDRELSQGLNARGEPLPGVRPTTREHRKSEMTASGRGDPRAPYLMPGRGLSRTRSLLTAKAHADYVVVWWRFDAFTGDQWGKVLAAHARRGKAYDVIGLSAKGKAWVAAKAIKAWRGWLAGKVPLPGVSLEAALDPGPVEVELVGRTNLDHATEGIGGTIEDARKAIAEGRSSGFLSENEWRKHFRQPRPAIVGAMEGTSYSVRKGKSNVLLQHVWASPGKPLGPSVGKAAPKPPKPAPAARAAMLPTAAPKAPVADASTLFGPSAPPIIPREEAARPKEFETDDERRAWVERTYGDGPDGAFWSSLARDQKDAIRDYTGSGSSQLNGYIRRGNLGGGGFLDDHYVRTARLIDSALASKPTPEDIIVYRGVGDPAPILRALGVASKQDIRPGMRFPDPTYTSTSLHPEVAEDFGGDLKFKIIVPRGSDAAYLGTNSNNDNEREFLLGRALDLFEVVGFDRGWVVVRAIMSGG